MKHYHEERPKLGISDLAHLMMSLSYTPADDRIPDTLRQAADEMEQLRSALEALTERAFKRSLFPREVKAALKALHI